MSRLLWGSILQSVSLLHRKTQCQWLPVTQQHNVSFMNRASAARRTLTTTCWLSDVSKVSLSSHSTPKKGAFMRRQTLVETEGAHCPDPGSAGSARGVSCEDRSSVRGTDRVAWWGQQQLPRAPRSAAARGEKLSRGGAQRSICHQQIAIASALSIGGLCSVRLTCARNLSRD